MAESPQTQKVTKRKPLTRPKVRAQVIAWMIEGVSDSEIARRVEMSREAVYHFRQRHQAEIVPVAAEIERQIVDYAIASKVNRIRELDALYTEIRSWLGEHSLSEKTYSEGGGVTIKLRSDAVAALRGLMRDAASELDQLPRGNNINIDNRTQILIRQVDGYDPSALG